MTTATVSPRTLTLTALAMVAFAANSLLCRAALRDTAIDAASFTVIRLAAGALMLWLIVRTRSKEAAPRTDWIAAVMLFVYAITFSFAYITLSVGTGALILFPAVQLTMFAVGLRAGEHFPALSWTGLAAAVAGLIYLVSPGVTAPDAGGALLMTAAGVAWGVYSLRGRGVTDPLRSTARNFLVAVPLGLLASLAVAGEFHAQPRGVILAVASGAVASALGYVIWYAALRGLSATGAATVQLAVPVIAAFGGVLLLGEAVTWRLAVASVAILGGIALVMAQRRVRRS